MKNKISTIILMLLLIGPTIVVAANNNGIFGNIEPPIGILELFFGPNIPEEFTENFYSVLQWLIFPFLSLWVILYGILSEVNIFRRKSHLNYWLALLIALIAGPTGALVYSVRTVFVLYGTLSFWGFAIVLFVGTGLWLYSFRFRWGLSEKTFSEAAESWDKREQILERLDQLELDIRRAPVGSQLKNDLIRRKNDLLDELNEYKNP